MTGSWLRITAYHMLFRRWRTIEQSANADGDRLDRGFKSVANLVSVRTRSALVRWALTGDINVRRDRQAPRTERPCQRRFASGHRT